MEKLISNKVRKYILVIIIIIGIGLLYFYQNRQPQLIEVILPKAIEHQNFVDQNINEDLKDLVVVETKDEEVKVFKNDEINNINLAVPFTSQAPTANWDQPWQDTCEEASLLMVDYYYQNKQLPSKAEIESLLGSMVTWQEDNWGGHFNLPVAKLAEYINLFYDYKVKVIENVTSSQLESFLDQGLPVIAPTNGHKLANPFFSGNGPDYHMLVIKGYVDNNFITNDPGTKRGENFIYTYQNMMNSIADWNIKKSSATGPKNVLILYNN